MKAIPTSALALLALVFLTTAALGAGDTSTLGPDSLPRAGVPRGELLTFDFAASQVFPGTTRKVTVYVPRQYDPAHPACVYVGQDGLNWSANVVLDNLIAAGQIPVVVGVFVTPGVVTALHPSAALNRFNRSLEYDGLGDAYARFLRDELLPLVETKSAADGRPLHLSHSGNDRAIGGGSSGAIAAFTVAWEHPEEFSRVISSVGTYVGLRGGDRYPTLVRKYEPKPIRVFLQDGSHDLNIYGGDWWMANQTMERALVFAGYEVSHEWGDGAHNGKHISAVLPEAMRWIWSGWPKPVARGVSRNAALTALLLPDQDWTVTAAGLGRAGAPSANRAGAVLFADLADGKTFQAPPEEAAAEQTAGMTAAAAGCYGPDGRLYGVSATHVFAQDEAGSETVIADGIAGRDLVVAHNGNIYVTEPAAGGSRVWLVQGKGKKQVVDVGLREASGITLSPDQSLLYVADAASHWIYSYQVRDDGTLADKQRYYWLHSADPEDAAHAGSLGCDQAGYLYAATDLGIQVCDQAGRVNAILPTPSGGATGLCFGGARFDTLFVASGATVYQRKLRATGAPPWGPPTLPPAPHL